MRNVELLQKLIFEHNESDIAHCLLVESKIDNVLDYISPDSLISAAIKNGATPSVFLNINDNINKADENRLKIDVPELFISDVGGDFMNLFSPVKNFKSLLLGDSVYLEFEHGIVYNYSKIQNLIQIAFINGKTKTYSLDDESVEILKRDYVKTVEDSGGWLL